MWLNKKNTKSLPVVLFSTYFEFFFVIALLRHEAVISPGQVLTASSSTSAASQEKESSDESSESSDSSDSEPRAKKKKKDKKRRNKKKSKKLRVDFRRGMFILSKVLKGIVHPEIKIVKALSE